jgi:DNA-binding transcriptional MerR regulator
MDTSCYPFVKSREKTLKVSELARRSGVTISTIKYYIREGLLRPGDVSAPNQAAYGEAHLNDLVLIRALRDHAGISISAIRRVLDAVAAAGSGSLEAGVHSVEVERRAGAEAPEIDPGDPQYQRAWDALRVVFEERDWHCDPASLEVQELLAAMIAVGRIWPYELPSGGWARYAELGEHAASFEIPDGWDPDRFPSETLRYAIVGTYLFEPVILAFRRVALSARSIRLQKARRELPDASASEPAQPWMMPARD